jgi:hypothetical protein
LVLSPDAEKPDPGAVAAILHRPCLNRFHVAMVRRLTEKVAPPRFSALC